MSVRKQKSLVLILARELATNLATPIYIADAERRETPIGDWVKELAPETLDGKPLDREEMPGGIAFAERRPAHGTMRVTGLDGQKRTVETTALPLFGPDGEFHGIMAIFWELH